MKETLFLSAVQQVRLTIEKAFLQNNVFYATVRLKTKLEIWQNITQNISFFEIFFGHPVKET